MVNIDKIKSLAYEKGISLTFICTKLGVARVYFNDLVKHNRDIPEERLATIAEILGTTPEYLRDETDQKEKPTEKEKALPDILYRYDELSEDKQREVIAFMEFKLAQQKEKPDVIIGKVAAFGSGPKSKPASKEAARKLATLAQKKKTEEEK